MRLDFCAVCGIKTDLHHHHFKAKFHGGSDLDTNMLTLCTKHHRELHGQNYRDNINHSKLTREGLQKAKKRGVKLGSPSPNIEYLAECRKKKALNDAKKVQHIILPLRKEGKSGRYIANYLNERGVKTEKGYKFNQTLVLRMIKRLENELK